MGYAPGDRVTHAQYGDGTLVSSNEYHVVINFDAHGRRTFSSPRVVEIPTNRATVAKLHASLDIARHLGLRAHPQESAYARRRRFAKLSSNKSGLVCLGSAASEAVGQVSTTSCHAVKTACR